MTSSGSRCWMTLSSRLEGPGLLACECPAEGLQAGRRRHGGVQKNFALRVAEIRATLPPGTPVEIWFQDEMRVGQKNKLTYRWARKGSRPRAIHDQRTQSTYLFGALSPERGAGAALVLPAMQHRGHAAPSRRNRNESHPRRTRRSHSRSSWMARRQRPQGSQKHRAPAAAAACAGAQPARKYLAIDAACEGLVPLLILRRESSITAADLRRMEDAIDQPVEIMSASLDRIGHRIIEVGIEVWKTKRLVGRSKADRGPWDACGRRSCRG